VSATQTQHPVPAPGEPLTETVQATRPTADWLARMQAVAELAEAKRGQPVPEKTQPESNDHADA